ncbi:MAG: hypothetical protein Terrestrivirus6_11 [Terrestrivirus sp.]|uniref:Uncharacterized protein n=1 Tax=Terrestrivirus sp. TaxID=2487775 RepID=A0A3G4ZNE4_9VIRU|nr:MAG: hypothetical protein Terrestrivirus6_11 [Terrestrivirus sp.]
MDARYFISDQIKFINHLLMESSTSDIQQSIKKSMTTITDIMMLERHLSELYFAVMANLYGDGIKIMNICRKYFETFDKEKNENYIGKLHSKYMSIIEIIQKKILDQFNNINDANMNNIDQVNQIYELLDLLDEPTQQKFLKELSDKICVTFPIGVFSKNADAQFNDVYKLLNDTKYEKLNKWNFKKYIIISWCTKLSESIFNENVQNITQNMMRQAKKYEDVFIKYGIGVNEDVVMVAFDKYKEIMLNKIFNEYKLPNILLELEETNFKFVNELTISLKNLDKLVSEFMTKRNIPKIISFYDKKINEFLEKIVDFYNKNVQNSNDILNDKYIIPTKNLFEAVTGLVADIKKKYNDFNIEPTKLKKYRSDVFKIYIIKHRNDIFDLINISLSKYSQNKIIKTMMVTTKTIMFMDKTDKMSKMIGTDGIDISGEIEMICAIIQKIGVLDNYVYSALFNEIAKEYERILIDGPNGFGTMATSPSITVYNKNVYIQAHMDITHIKNTFKNSQNITQNLKELEYKLVLIPGDISDEKKFVEQYVSMFPKGTIDDLKKIIKIKDISPNSTNNIIKIYTAICTTIKKN